MRLLWVLAILPLVAGCLPSSGPGSGAIRSSGSGSAAAFDVIALDQAIAESLSVAPAGSLSATFGMGGGAAQLAIGVGDLVVVTVFEAASGGLFSGDAGTVGGSKNVSLPSQPVARDGTIGVPYAGRVRAVGLLAADVQKNIEAALREKAIEPQVIVTVTQSAASSVTVAGEVGRPGRVPLMLRGDRVLDVLATAGGSRAADYDTFVSITRGDRSATVSLARVVHDSSQNIYLRPDDLLYVSIDPQIYTVFGATLANATIPFQTERLTLAAAVGRAGGLNDLRADASGVYVFRYEAPGTYFQISGGRTPPALTPAGVPVVYKLSLKDPRGFFVAQRFLMRDNDVLYVTNAAAVDVQKIFGIVNGSVGTAASSTSLTDTLLNGE